MTDRDGPLEKILADVALGPFSGAAESVQIAADNEE